MKNDNIAVIAENITKEYKMYSNKNEKLSDLLFHRKENIRHMYALKGVSFTATQGESIGLVGLNGSGKSTLANILAGVSKPTEGNIILNGEPAVVSISSGLNNLLTGLENIELKGLIIGLSSEQIKKFTKKIIDFADVGAYITQPVKTYSSGMRARLGFAISVTIDPDIMIIDEALSVGDPSFTDRCLNEMNGFRERGKTIFFVSHNLAQIKSFCNKVLWLEYGVLKAYGTVDEVLPMYERFINTYNQMTPEEREDYSKTIIENHNHFLLQ